MLQPFITPTDSTDLSPPDYSLFPQGKMKLIWLHFAHVAEIQEAVTWWIKVRSQKRNFRQLFRKFTTALMPEYTGLFKMIFGVLTTCHTQYTWDSSIWIFLFNRTTLPVFVTYLTCALYVHPLWFYKHQHENRVRSKLFVACQLFAVRRHLSKLRSKRRNA